MGEVSLNNTFHVSQIHQSLHVLRDKYLGSRNIDHLLHPIVKFTPRGLIVLTQFPGMILIRLKSQTFTRDTEILARKTSRDDIYIFRENFFSRSMLFHQVYDTLCIINVFIISESIHILKPSGLCLFQYIIRKDRSKTILL